MGTVTAYGAPAEGERLTRLTIERRAVGPRDVLIEIAYCGICHSDIHTLRGEWGPHPFPVVPGHEITGQVVQVGGEVTLHKVNDRVGVGCMVRSCGSCADCRRGEEQYCVDVVATYASVDQDGTPTQGGYATHIVVDERFVLRIPHSLALDQAAPLLCAGITTYSALRRHATGPGSRVGVIGMGGLGHLAVRLANAMGAEVTVLSQSLRKREHSIRLGAIDHLALSDKESLGSLERRLDLLLSTVSADLDVDALLGLLATKGTLAFVGVPPNPISISALPFEDRGLCVSGSSIGGIQETQELLEFCAKHSIGADIEFVEPSQINDAYERVLASDVLFRFVIDMRAS